MFVPNYWNTTPDRYGLPAASIDAGGRVRTSRPTTLGDYKQVGYDHTVLYNTAGTGTGGWANNKFTMSVAGNQYYIWQSDRVHPYFSGKSQLVEITNDRMQHEAGVVKRWGYFSSSVTPPHTASLDGFWLESDGTDYYIVSSRDGTETARVPSQGWKNWTYINRYNWQMFSVIFFDFLWLGGAVLNMWVKTEVGFVLAHTIHYAGTSEDTFIRNPAQPLRCEIRATNAGGQMRFICAQIATEGQIDEAGLGGVVNTGTAEINLASVDTTYPLIAIRKQAALLNSAVELTGVNVGVNSANDRAIWSVQINPTLSAPLTYGNVTGTAIQKANGTGAITVSAPGYLLASGPVSTNVPIPRDDFERNFLTVLSQTLTGGMDEYVLCIGTQSSGIDATGYMYFKEY